MSHQTHQRGILPDLSLFYCRQEDVVENLAVYSSRYEDSGDGALRPVQVSFHTVLHQQVGPALDLLILWVVSGRLWGLHWLSWPGRWGRLGGSRIPAGQGTVIMLQQAIV